MKPYYEDERITLYHGDARDVTLGLPPGSTHCVLTDPPYGMNYESGYSGATVRMDGTRLCLRMYRELLPQINRVMADDAHLYWFTRWDVWTDAHDSIAAHLPVKNMLIWDKGHPGMGDLSLYGYSFEMAVFAAKGRRKLIGGRPNSVFAYPPVPNARRHHPTEKPGDLLGDWISRSTLPGEVVLDPFAGSGSTLLAAAHLNRRSIGIEIDERYCEIVATRLDQGAFDFDAVS